MSTGGPPDEPSLLAEDLEELYEQATCGYITTLPDGRIVRANRTLLTWTGYNADELVGSVRFVDLLTPGGRLYHETHYAPLLRMQHEVRELALEIVRKDGTRIPVLVNAKAKRDDDGNLLLIRITVFEATDRRRYERELLHERRRAEASEARSRALARTLQESLIPPHPPRIPGLDVAAAYRPAGRGDEVGGDFYDVFDVPGGWVVVAGDVAGKGVAAAKTTAMVRYTVRAAAPHTAEPDGVLRFVNDALLRDESYGLCTAVFARLSALENGRWRAAVASGGHPLPLLVSPGGGVREAGRAGCMLGILDAPEVPAAAVDLEPGDALVLYTDGIPEGRRGAEFYGDQRLRRLLAESANLDAQALSARLITDVVNFQEGSPRDDIAFVVLKVPAA